MDGEDPMTAVMDAPCMRGALRFSDNPCFHGPARILRGAMIAASAGSTQLESVEIEALEDRGFGVAFLTHEIDGAPQEILFARGAAASLDQRLSALSPLEEGGFRLEYLLLSETSAFGLSGLFGLRFDCPEPQAACGSEAPSRALPHGALGVLTIGAAQMI